MEKELSYFGLLENNFLNQVLFLDSHQFEILFINSSSPAFLSFLTHLDWVWLNWHHFLRFWKISSCFHGLFSYHQMGKKSICWAEKSNFFFVLKVLFRKIRLNLQLSPENLIKLLGSFGITNPLKMLSWNIWNCKEQMGK